jgi:hypothetical protein
MKTTQVVSVVVVLVASLASARDVRAQGLLQVTFDRDSWPTEEAQRTIVIPQDMTQLQLVAGVTTNDFATSYGLVPTVSFGLTPNITVGGSYQPDVVSFGDGMMGTTTDTTLSAGSVFAVARPFNSYDFGIRVGLPFELEDPIVNLDVELVGRISLSLDTVSWFFNTGVIANIYNGVAPVEGPEGTITDIPTEYVANTYIAFQLNEQLSLSPGVSFLYDGDHPNLQLYGHVQYAIDHQIDLFGMAGFIVEHDTNATFVTVGANVWL